RVMVGCAASEWTAPNPRAPCANASPAFLLYVLGAARPHGRRLGSGAAHSQLLWRGAPKLDARPCCRHGTFLGPSYTTAGETPRMQPHNVKASACNSSYL